MYRLKQYFNRFIYQDDGAELVEYCIVVAVVAVLAAAVFAVVGAVKNQIENAGTQISGLDPSSIGSSTTPTTATEALGGVN